MKKISDILALALLLLGVWMFMSIMKILPDLASIIGIVGSVILIISQGWFLINKWRKG